jgi:NAD(P)-dependent dehydrogenase (short-subunit alcohol dehydrogenase family)
MPNTQRSVVTGAASGIGQAVVEELTRRGDTVVGVDVVAGGDWLVADLSQPAERARVIDHAVSELGGVDVLVNVAGIYRPTPIPGSTLEQWREVWAVNLEAPLELMALALPVMAQAGGGWMCNITSVHARASRPDCVAYDVGKAGLEAATRSLAISGGRHGVLVNAVSPGFVRTAMALTEDGVDESDTEAFRTLFVDSGRIPVGRSADAREIAAAVSFLTSVANTYTTGQVLVVDGGLLATI